MFNWFKKVEKEVEKEVVKEPEVGERWVFNDDDPWGGKKFPPVKILDVKDGWVRYYIGHYYSDERREMDSFLYIYKFYK